MGGSPIRGELLPKTPTFAWKTISIWRKIPCMGQLWTVRNINTAEYEFGTSLAPQKKKKKIQLELHDNNIHDLHRLKNEVNHEKKDVHKFTSLCWRPFLSVKKPMIEKISLSSFNSKWSEFLSFCTIRRKLFYAV